MQDTSRAFRYFKWHCTATKDTPSDALQIAQLLLFSNDALPESEAQAALKSIGKDVWDGNNGASKHLGFGFLYDLATGALNMDAIARGHATGCARVFAKIWCEQLMFKVPCPPSL